MSAVSVTQDIFFSKHVKIYQLLFEITNFRWKFKISIHESHIGSHLQKFLNSANDLSASTKCFWNPGWTLFSIENILNFHKGSQLGATLGIPITILKDFINIFSVIHWSPFPIEIFAAWIQVVSYLGAIIDVHIFIWKIPQLFAFTTIPNVSKGQ